MTENQGPEISRFVALIRRASTDLPADMEAALARPKPAKAPAPPPPRPTPS
ncbi:MAG: hypothetical protein JW918_13715 [Anaerolineae bacterium]|nr:hypothetical protein [Anaerolineae bacterium]